MALPAEALAALEPEVRRDLFAVREACGGPARRLYDRVTDRRWAARSWLPHYPTPRQAAFLTYMGREALYGGAAGGGKTDAALMAAAQFICVPGYNAIIYRQTYGQLAQDGGLIERSHEWWTGHAEYHSGGHRWTFPSGASITFGALQHEKDKHKYQGAQFHFVYFDELTNFPSSKAYVYLFSRLRRPEPDETLRRCPGCGLTAGHVPLRMRAGTNPGGVGGQWVYERFIRPWRDMRSGNLPPDEHRVFIPSLLRDNPYLDYDAYVASLSELDPVERARLLDGDWDVRDKGSMFDRFTIPIVDDWPRDAEVVRYWDLASTEEKPGSDPDWTVGALVAVKDGQAWVVDIDRFRAGPGEVERRIRGRADMDGRHVPVVIEREPGASGKIAAANFLRRTLAGYEAYEDPKSSSKAEAARPWSAAAANGNVFVVRAPWNDAFFDEVEMFPHDGYHDDQVDAVSGGFNWLHGFAGRRRGGLRA